MTPIGGRPSLIQPRIGRPYFPSYQDHKVHCQVQDSCHYHYVVHFYNFASLLLKEQERLLEDFVELFLTFSMFKRLSICGKKAGFDGDFRCWLIDNIFVTFPIDDRPAFTSEMVKIFKVINYCYSQDNGVQKYRLWQLISMYLNLQKNIYFSNVTNGLILRILK